MYVFCFVTHVGQQGWEMMMMMMMTMIMMMMVEFVTIRLLAVLSFW